MVRVKKRYLCLSFQRAGDLGRKKKRALVPGAEQPLPLTDPVLYAAIRGKVQEFHGDFGVASVTSGLRILYANPLTKVCLVQCRHGAHRIVASVLPFLTRLGDESVVPRLIYTGATVRNCYKVILIRDSFDHFCYNTNFH